MTILKKRPYNFAAGPAAIPESVLKRCQEELLDYQGLGVSILELGHRTKVFESLVLEVEQKLRQAIAAPENYKILFLHGGARLQFSGIPLNLLGKNPEADYLITGHWSQVAFQEAQKYAPVQCVGTSEDQEFFGLPAVDTWKINPNAAYRYCCSNETLVGVQFQEFPLLDEVPWVVDMTSDFLSRCIDVNRFGLIFASTQKTMGTSGLCVVLVREDLLNQKMSITPTVTDFAEQVKQHSLYNTPNVFAIYILGLMLDWLAEQGGVAGTEKINQRKAEKLYQFIDQGDFYRNRVEVSARSMMNVSFNLPTPDLEKLFLQEATKHNLLNLKGHSLTGGARASLYNPIPEAAVDALLDFMRAFQNNHAGSFTL